MPVDNDDLYAFLRRTADQTLLVLVNLSEEPITDYRFCLQDGGLAAGNRPLRFCIIALPMPLRSRPQVALKAIRPLQNWPLTAPIFIELE